MTGFQLRRLRLTGPKTSEAEIEFGPGLNVISGASDTGKSYVVELLDFMLGGTSVPRNIPESSGYDVAHLSIAAADGRRFELTRALQGGDLALSEFGDISKNSGVTLAARHSSKKTDNISAFLLRLIGLDGKRVRKNAENELQNLSFRNLSHLFIVDEESIIKKGSPLFSGESTARTAQINTFKLLLTGVDDSALIASKKQKVARAEVEAQLFLLDQLLDEGTQTLARLTEDPSDLPAQLSRLDAAIDELRVSLENERSQLRELEVERRAAWDSRDRILVQQADADGLLERFELLDQHYTTDIARLQSISEAGSFFIALEVGSCPLCGAPAGDHSHDGSPPHDGDIEAVRLACDLEMRKTLQLRAELSQAVSDLKSEKANLATQLAVAHDAFAVANRRIETALSPSIEKLHRQYSELTETRSSVRQALVQQERVSSLLGRRADMEGVLSMAFRQGDERPGLPAGALKVFTDNVAMLLSAWHFPHEKPVYFDERRSDLVLGPRRRGDQGKGLRALTHSAFTIGLHEACRSLSLPVVGFVILDSPLVTFREVENSEVGLDSETQLKVKQAFYRDLAERIKTDQVIVIENEDPDATLLPEIVFHLFTKRVGDDRFGFFPSSSVPS